MATKPTIYPDTFSPSSDFTKRGIFPYTAVKLHECFIEGTRIYLDDNTHKSVEKLVAATPSNPASGDSILTIDGTRAHVIGSVGGPAFGSCVEIKARTITRPQKSFRVTVTRHHAVALENARLSHAWLLRPGDRLTTPIGEAVVKSADVVDSKSFVWNIVLASEEFVRDVLPNIDSESIYYYRAESLLGLTPEQHLIFGDGILCGDLNLQVRLLREARRGQRLSLLS